MHRALGEILLCVCGEHLRLMSISPRKGGGIFTHTPQEWDQNYAYLLGPSFWE